MVLSTSIPDGLLELRRSDATEQCQRNESDLAIAVDTAVADPAGAMGQRIWTLLPFSPDWRWLLGRSDSP